MVATPAVVTQPIGNGRPVHDAGGLAEAAVSALRDGGALSTLLPNYRERAQQCDMAGHVAETVDNGGTLLVEAGTGTGKTMAYLLPALLSGKRTVVSTGTKHLQDQLYHRDLPRALEALRLPRKTALLKGRDNYLCRYRLVRAAEQASGADAEAILSLRAFMESSESGELADYGRIGDTSPLRARVTSTTDNCLGTRCGDYESCFVVRARRRALDADLVVVNHHLLFADFAIREAGFSEILPGAEVVIVDEAHQLPELAANAFGERLSTRQLNELLRDLRLWPLLADNPDLDARIRQVGSGIAVVEECFEHLRARVPVGEFLARPGTGDALAALCGDLASLAAALDAAAPADDDTRKLSERLRVAAALLQRFCGDGDVQAVSPEDDAAGAATFVRWAERFKQRGGSLCASPVDVSVPFRQATAGHPGAWIYVSATLGVNGSFSLFRSQLGIDDAAQDVVLPQVFDYAAQSRLWIPQGLPAPRFDADTHTHALIECVLPVLEAAGGGAFLLMTTHKAVRAAADMLEANGRFQCFVQGDDDRARLLRRFADSSHGVLIGAASYWEGVDVPGAALRMVVIDKLPFAPPQDPLVAARIRQAEESGERAFMSYQLPQAILGLRQGVGRLIRSEQDRGLVIIGDPRLHQKGYAAQVIRALPPMTLLQSFDEAVAYAGSLHPDAPGAVAVSGCDAADTDA